VKPVSEQKVLLKCEKLLKPQSKAISEIGLSFDINSFFDKEILLWEI